jgi:hypothetical protein
MFSRKDHIKYIKHDIAMCREYLDRLELHLEEIE